MPFELDRRKLPPSVCVPVPPMALPGSLYGAGGAGAGKLAWFGSQLVGSNWPVLSVVQIGAAFRNALAVSLIVRTAVDGDPNGEPVNVRFTVSGISGSVSLQSVTNTVFDVSPGANVTAWFVIVT